MGGEEYSLVAAYGSAGIAIVLRSPDGTQIPSNQEVFEIAALRIIVVPPGVVITPKMGFNDLTSLSYDEVTAVLGIRE